MHVTNERATGLYRDVLHEILSYGAPARPRGIETLEIIGARIELSDARMNIVGSPSRKLNYHFMVAEALWILLGQNDVRTVATFNSKIAEYSDDGVTFAGAYGPKVIEQLSYVVDTLRVDPDSRQAVINIWRERPRAARDIPCTLSLQFLVREEELHLVTTMRSNDAWRGLPYDLFTFTTIQHYVAAALELPVGRYVHNVGSLHLYEADVEAARAVVDEHPHKTERYGVEDHKPLTYPVPPIVRSTLARLAMVPESEDAREIAASLMPLQSLGAWRDLLIALTTRFTRINNTYRPWDFLLPRCGIIKVGEA